MYHAHAYKLMLCVQLQDLLGHDMSTIMLFLHAITGSDATSRPYGVGKAASLKKMQKSSTLVEQAKVFMDPLSSHDQIVNAGDIAMRVLMGGKTSETLDDMRYRQFHCKALKSTATVKAESLPPTAAATKYHSMRVFHQVMSWKGIDLQPCDWGWCEEQGQLYPIKTDLPAAPDSLLKIIWCKCKTNCRTLKCTCRSYNLKCTDLCTACQRDNTCTNSANIEE